MVRHKSCGLSRKLAGAVTPHRELVVAKDEAVLWDSAAECFSLMQISTNPDQYARGFSELAARLHHEERELGGTNR